MCNENITIIVENTVDSTDLHVTSEELHDGGLKLTCKVCNESYVIDTSTPVSEQDDKRIKFEGKHAHYDTRTKN